MKGPRDPRKDHLQVEETENGIVIHLPAFGSLQMKETADMRVGVKPRAPGEYPCGHWRTGVLVDKDKRTAECAKCGVVLDPLDALFEMSKAHDRIRSDFTRAQSEIQDARLRLEVLERLEKNVRERLKRLGVKHDDGWFHRNLSSVLKQIVIAVRKEEVAK